jgi:large-conductance mechanosensitive channel
MDNDSDPVIVQFNKHANLFTVGVFAGIFTWFFINAMRNDILLPLILSYFPTAISRFRIDVNSEAMPAYRYIDVGKFVSEVLVYIVVMLPLIAIWHTTHRKKQ